MIKKIKTVLLIAHDALPVPDVYGGAIEFLITRLLEENENNGQLRFVVTSTYFKESKRFNYKNSRIYYFENNKLSGDHYGNFAFNYWKWYHRRIRLTNKIFHNRITKQLFGNPRKMMDCITFQLLQITKKEKPNYAVVELCRNINQILPIINKIGKENVYYHIHNHMLQDMRIRSIIPNSISISEFVKKEWAVNASIIGDNRVLYNCADLMFFNNIRVLQKIKLKKRLKICNDEVVILFCGRFIPGKGVKQLLDAMGILQDKKIKLLLIGSEKFANGNISSFSKQIVERAKAMENVIYLGYIPNDKLPQYYSISDIQVIPSIWQEGAGIVAIEGMAMGLPLIITDSGGMVEYVNDECAVKVPISENLNENLANEILRLSNDDMLRKKMGFAGKMRAKKFSSKNYYQNFVKIFE